MNLGGGVDVGTGRGVDVGTGVEVGSVSSTGMSFCHIGYVGGGNTLPVFVRLGSHSRVISPLSVCSPGCLGVTFQSHSANDRVRGCCSGLRSSWSKLLAANAAVAKGSYPVPKAAPNVAPTVPTGVAYELLSIKLLSSMPDLEVR